MISIKGNSFGKDYSEITIEANGFSCSIKKITNTKIDCYVIPGQLSKNHYQLGSSGVVMYILNT